MTEPTPTPEAVAEPGFESVVAVAGHPLHAMFVHFPIALGVLLFGADVMYWWGGDEFWLRAGVWMAGVAFVMGLGAVLTGLGEVALIKGLRHLPAVWAHAIIALTLLALIGVNWGMRMGDPAGVWPLPLIASALGLVLTGFAGWHGGKLTYHHGVGINED